MRKKSSKFTNIIIPLGVGIVLFAGAIFILNPNAVSDLYSSWFDKGMPVSNAGATATSTSATPDFSYKTINDADPNGLWKFSATYPVFDTSFGPTVLQINTAIEGDIKKIETDSTSSIGSTTATGIDPLEVSVNASATSSATFGTVSVLYSAFVDGGEMAHPYTDYTSSTWTLSDGSLKNLTDIFPKAGFLTKLAAISEQQLASYYQAQGTADTSFLDQNDGLTADQSNFDNFLLSDNALIIQFEEYQLGSRPYGAPQIEIPLDQLSAFNGGTQ